jgi:hypothetical protein
MVFATPGLNINGYRDDCSAGLVVAPETAAAAGPACATQRHNSQATAEFVALHRKELQFRSQNTTFPRPPPGGSLVSKVTMPGKPKLQSQNLRGPRLQKPAMQWRSYRSQPQNDALNGTLFTHYLSKICHKGSKVSRKGRRFLCHAC